MGISAVYKGAVGLLRRIKEWMESFSEKKYAMTALFILAFAESSFFPIPPDVLLIAIAVSAPKKAFKAALWCTLGSVSGAVLGYYIGSGLMETVGSKIVEFYHAEDLKQQLMLQFQGDVGLISLAGAAFTPIPFKVFTIVCGAAEMNLLFFILISAIFRGARFFLVGGLIYFVGPKVKTFIDKYFDVLSIVFLILLIGGFVLIKYVL